ncbi:26072_t:CDS:2, partial [Gigaspora margarita]
KLNYQEVLLIKSENVIVTESNGLAFGKKVLANALCKDSVLMSFDLDELDWKNKKIENNAIKELVKKHEPNYVENNENKASVDKR